MSTLENQAARPFIGGLIGAGISAPISFAIASKPLQEADTKFKINKQQLEEQMLPRDEYLQREAQLKLDYKLEKMALVQATKRKARLGTFIGAVLGSLGGFLLKPR